MSTENQHVHVFPLDAIVSIEISGAYYTRVSKLLADMLMQKPQEELVKLMSDLNQRAPETDEEYNILTLIILVNEIEKAVKDQEKFELVNPDDYEKSDEDSN